ncbi:MAG TPA: phosphotransferase, partial [Spirochaetia bacterium]|nr:phosphotransferase [Spirochaetia bacterium]
MTGSGDRKQQVRDFLREHGWVTGDFTVAFLAAGEYNENYLVTSSARRAVFRINHGSQLNLDDQIGYEFGVLESVAPSGVTPLPIAVCSSHRSFPRGALLMSYIPGRHLDYNTDLPAAA